MRNDWPLRGLYAITPDEPDTQALLLRVEAVLGQGVAMVQYRNKPAPTSLRLEQALGLKLLCRPYGVPLIINDDIQLAREIHADGVHLGECDGGPLLAHKELGDQVLIGVSCYDSIERARTAVSQGADYLAFGAFFSSPTKPDAQLADMHVLSEAQLLGLPLVAIGGIRPDNVQLLREAGADLIAVISGLWDTPDPARAARAYIDAFDNIH